MQNEVVCSLPHSAHSASRNALSIVRLWRERAGAQADRSAECERAGGLALAELLVGRPPDPPTLFSQAQTTTLAHFSA